MAEAVTIGSCTLYCGDLLRAAEIVSASAAGLPKSLGGDNEALAARLREAAETDLLSAENALNDSVLSKIEDDAVEAANKLHGVFDMDAYYATMRAGIIRALEARAIEGADMSLAEELAVLSEKAAIMI